MRLDSFGAVTFPKMNNVQQLPVSYRSSVVALRGGGYDQDGANVYLEPKVISLSFWVSVVDVANLDTFIDSLYSEADIGRRILVARMRDNSQRQAEAKLLTAATMPDARTYIPDSILDLDGYERMQVSFEIVYPYWLATEDAALFLDEGWFMNDGVVLDSGQQTEITTSTAVNTFTINNNGGVKHENCELTITALAGATITDVLVENLTTGEELLWEGTIAAASSLVIKTLPQTIRLDGTDEYANTTLPATQLGFWKLPLGDNDFRVTFTNLAGGDAEIVYAWMRHYVR